MIRTLDFLNCSSLLIKEYGDFEKSFNNHLFRYGKKEIIVKNDLNNFVPITTKFKVNIIHKSFEHSRNCHYKTRIEENHSCCLIELETECNRVEWGKIITSLFEIYTSRLPKYIIDLVITLRSFRGYEVFRQSEKVNIFIEYLEKITMLLNKASGRILTKEEASFICEEGKYLTHNTDFITKESISNYQWMNGPRFKQTTI